MENKFVIYCPHVAGSGIAMNFWKIPSKSRPVCDQINMKPNTKHFLATSEIPFPHLGVVSLPSEVTWGVV